MLSVVFTDDYSANTAANYTETAQTQPPAFQDSWTVSGGTLNYAVPTSDNNWNTSVFLTKPATASTSGLLVSRTSGDLIGPKAFQAGLVLSGDPTAGGFVVAEYDNGIYNNHLVLLRETGGQLTGDEGGTGNPPVLADFGDISASNTDTFHVVGTIDRTGAHPVITVAISDLTNPSNAIATQTVSDATDAANYGGNAIGWRARFHDNTPAFSVDNLQLENVIPPAAQAPTAPTNLTATQAANSTNVNLSWTNTAVGVFQFNVERSADGLNWARIATVAPVAQNATATYTDPIVSPPGQPYLYRVSAVNGFQGGSVSPPSNVATITIGPVTHPNFLDDYSTDTTGNYVETTSTAPPTLADSWLVYGGNLNYTVQATNGWNTSLFLLKPSIANTAGMYKFTTSGDIIAPQNFQPGLVLSGDTTSGGFVVQEYAGSHHFVLLRETGGQITGDEGGAGNPPVLADFGDISTHATDTYHVVGTVDRSGAHPVITVAITDLTDGTFVIPSQTVTDAIDPASYGGVQIGWRARYNTTDTVVTVDNLMLQQVALPSATHAPAAPTNLTATLSGVNVTLTWTNNADNATDVIVQRSSNPNGGFVSIGDVAPGAQGSTGTFTETPVAPAGTVYYYRVIAFNGFQGGTQSAPSNVVSVTINNPAGATATWYNQGFWAGAPVDSQNVATIDYSDANGAAGDPTKVTNTGENSIVYSGKIKITTAGTYTFISNTSEDGYLYVDGTLVSSDPGDHAQRNATNVTPLNLAVGQHDFVMMQTWARYVGFDGGEGAHLLWVTPGSTAPVLVPATAMVPSSDTPAVPSAPTITTTTSNAIDMTFTANNNAVVHYQLQRSGDGGTTWTTISQLDPGSNGQTGGVAGTSVTMTAEDASPIQGATYKYRVIAVGADAPSAAGPASTATPVPAYAVAPSTPGVEAHYFNAELWKTRNPPQLGSPDEYQLLQFNSPPNLTGGIDFALGGNQSPDLAPFPDLPRIHPISFSAVYTGRIMTDGPGVYTFISNTDDDGYLYVNSVLVSSDPGGHAPEIPAAANIHPLTLQGNTAYDFVFLFNQDAGGSGIHVSWIEPGTTFTPAAAPPIPMASSPAGGFLQASDVPFKQVVDATGVVTTDPTASAAGNPTGSTPTTGTGAVISWTDQSTSELWFEVQRGASASGPFTTVGTTQMNGTSFTDTTAVSGTTYFYRVRGVNYDGVGPFSTPISVLAGGGIVTQTINGTSGNDTITIKRDADGTHDDVWINVPTTGPATEQSLVGQTIVINGNGGTDTLVFDSSAGNPVPTGTGNPVLRLNSGTGTFTLGGTAPTLDASHVVDLGTSTLNIPYTGTSPIPVIRAYLAGGMIKSTEAAASGGKFAVSDTDTGTQIALKYSVIGDADTNGTVGFPDLLKLAQHYGQSGQNWSTGDFNYDGIVGFPDLLLLAQHYGQTSPVAAGSVASAAAASGLSSPADTLASALLKGKKSRKH